MTSTLPLAGVEETDTDEVRLKVAPIAADREPPLCRGCEAEGRCSMEQELRVVALPSTMRELGFVYRGIGRR